MFTVHFKTVFGDELTKGFAELISAENYAEIICKHYGNAINDLWITEDF